MGPGKGEGRAGGWERKVCMHKHAHTNTNTISSLIYFRSVLMSSWPWPQLLSADDLAPVLMKKQGNSTQVKIHIHTNTTHTHVRTHAVLVKLRGGDLYLLKHKHAHTPTMTFK